MLDQRHGFATAEDGTRIFYEVQGEGPVVVLSDGIGCDGFVWRYLTPHLARTHRVIHWHYRGHGRSGPPRDRTRLSIADHARDLRSVLDHLEVDRAVVAGHSMGTQVALEGYRLLGERIDGLALLCGSYGRITHTFHGSDKLNQLLPTVIRAVQENRGLTRAIWGRVPSSLAFRIACLSREVDKLHIREEDFRSYWEHIVVMDPDLFLAMLREAGDHSAEDLLERIHVPTLVVAAGRDTFTPANVVRTMAESIPDVELVDLEGASHAAPVERPKAIEEAFDRLLARAGRRREHAEGSPPERRGTGG